MPQLQSPDAYREILLPKSAAGIISAYEALTEAEVRTSAQAVLENPVFRRVLVDLQDQVIANLRMTSLAADMERHGLTLVAIDLVLGALIGEAFTTRNNPIDE